MKMLRLILVLTMFFSVADFSLAAKAGPVDFSDGVKEADTSLRLLGAGLKRFVKLKVLSVGFYIQEGVDTRLALTDVAKRIEIVYLLSIPKAELDHATTKGISRNVTPNEFVKLQSRIAQINSYYSDVKYGDRIAVTYIPNIGTQVKINGQLRGTIKGSDFAHAFFSIWIGEKPVDKNIKMILLGKGR